MKSRKAFKSRIFPSRAQQTKLEAAHRLYRELHNGALQEHREAYGWWVKALTITTRLTSLPRFAIKEVRPDFKQVYYQVLQDVLKRVDK